ncbi:MAG: histidine phosphatase family protein [Candidatus Obscuribacterales bacterium]|nr:histidine phosphatase family protein [Candidatus Obscuribacterales bacterium]
MKLLLSRHGNTFDPGDRIFWVGRSEDMPLVEKGRQQADDLGTVLKKSRALVAIYSGPLMRTRDYAAIVGEHLAEKPPILVDKRLDELDYGQWSGLTDLEVAEKFGEESLNGWNRHCQWPTEAGWDSNPDEVLAQVRGFVEEVAEKYPPDSTVLAITSNGVLRYFLKLDESSFADRVEQGSFKVATGRVCLLTIESGAVKVDIWDVLPFRLQELLIAEKIVV